MPKKLGLDLGTNSIGWSCIDEEKQKIIALGTIVFPAGVDKLGEGDKEISKNAARREARGTRRQHFRRRLRNKLLLKLLAKHKLCPLNQSDFNQWKTTKTFPEATLAAWFSHNPYELRVRALNEKLTLHQLGRLLYHMLQRRGFQSNRKQGLSKEDTSIHTGQKATSQKPVSKLGINATQARINQDGHTLGHSLYQLHPQHGESYVAGLERIRARYTERSMYKDEFDKIWNHQASTACHPHLATTKEGDVLLRHAIGGRKKKGDPIDGILFFQRPLKSQKHLLGRCTLEPGKPRAPKSSLSFQYFRIYQWVNSVTCNEAVLTATEREQVAQHLMTHEKPTFKSIRKILQKQGAQYRFNYPDTYKSKPKKKATPKEAPTKITGSPTLAKLSNAFGKKVWESKKEKQAIWHILHTFDDPDQLYTYAQEKWDCTPQQAEDITNIQLEPGYANLSTKAINNILPFLKKGHQYHNATALGGVKNAFGNKWNKLSSTEQQDIQKKVIDIIKPHKGSTYLTRLKDLLHATHGLAYDLLDKKLYHHSQFKNTSDAPSLPVGLDGDKKIQDLRNPVVIKALFILRTFINAFIAKHGKPEKIVVELGRDLKRSKKARQAIQAQQRAHEATNQDIWNELEIACQKYGIQPTRYLHRKYKLWKEADEKCVYTGDTIRVEQVLSNTTEIDHALPWIRSLDNSHCNVVLTFSHTNREKSNHTPYEYFQTQGEHAWQDFKARMYRQFSQDNPAKYKHLIRKTIPEGFTNRHLNDTRYISREARNYLTQICRNVEVVPGSLTAHLRRHWNLNSLLKTKSSDTANDKNKDHKPRHDHRHHALDATLIACSHQKYLKTLIAYNPYAAQHSHHVKPAKLPLPWENFREDVKKALTPLLVVHKQRSRLLTIRTHTCKKEGEEYKNKGQAARGQLHNEFYYGLRQAPQQAEASYHKRKHLRNIKTSTNVNKIVDPNIRALIKERITALGGYLNETLPKNTFFKDKKPQIVLPSSQGGEDMHLNTVYLADAPEKSIDLNKIKTREQVNQIIDDKNKRRIQNRITELGGYVGTVPPGIFFKDHQPQIHLPNYQGGDPVPVRKVRLRENLSYAAQSPRDKNHEINRYVNPGNNDHILIYKYPHDKERHEVQVTFWEAARRATQGKPVIQAPDGTEVLYVLRKGDMYLLDYPHELPPEGLTPAQASPYLYKLKKISKAFTFIHHTVAKLIDTKTGKKIDVDNYKFDATLHPFPLVVRKSCNSLEAIRVKLSITGQLQPI